MLAAAIAAAHLNILVAHLHGGEVSGTIDESIRHSISKLAHLHLPATKGSAERLRRMGENEWRIHVVGAPRIETIRRTTLPLLDEVLGRYNLGGMKIFISSFTIQLLQSLLWSFFWRRFCTFFSRRRK